MIVSVLEQLPVLQVVLPLLAAPLCVILRRRSLAWALFVAITWVGLAISALLAGQVALGGPVTYALGGWNPPVGIAYRIDHFNAFVLVVVSGIAAVVAPYARASVMAEVPAERGYLFYALLLLLLAGLLGITITGDAFNLFVFLEISSLSSYALIAMGTSRRALMASFQYLIMGTIGATFLLIGIGLLYMMTGTLNMADLAERLPAVYGTSTVEAALAFIVIGASLKLALFPLHAWLPGAYGTAPSVVSAFLAATATKVAAYTLIRFLFTIFGVGFAFGTLPAGPVLGALAVAAMLYGSFAALFADDLKRLLAWSSVAQIGYIVLGVALATPAGLTAAILHLLNHGVIKGALFLAAGCLFWRLGSTRLTDLAGAARLMPWTCAAIVAAGLGLIGIPGTAGFITKWYLLVALLDSPVPWLVAVVLVTSLLAALYLGRVVEMLYFRAPSATAAESGEAPVSMLAATWVLVALNFAIGLHSAPAVKYAQAAAATLLGDAS
ncbi:MAG: monovalent cation/H+ antiporter subunit D family protein [Salinisphaera sp.]|nr:monovalent cation/H+ antiporter subunit D family protein [Salinisphaera sp.]